MNCCDYDCDQGRNCPARAEVARIKSTRPAWMDGKGIPSEAGNFQIQYLGPDENMTLVRTLLIWLVSVLGTVALVSVLVSFGTERFADLIWSYLAQLS